MEITLHLSEDLTQRLYELLNCIEQCKHAQAYTIEQLIADLLDDVVDVWLDRCRHGELEEFWEP